MKNIRILLIAIFGTFLASFSQKAHATLSATITSTDTDYLVDNCSLLAQGLQTGATEITYTISLQNSGSVSEAYSLTFGDPLTAVASPTCTSNTSTSISPITGQAVPVWTGNILGGATMTFTVTYQMNQILSMVGDLNAPYGGVPVQLNASIMLNGAGTSTSINVIMQDHLMDFNMNATFTGTYNPTTNQIEVSAPVGATPIGGNVVVDTYYEEWTVNGVGTAASPWYISPVTLDINPLTPGTYVITRLVFDYCGQGPSTYTTSVTVPPSACTAPVLSLAATATACANVGLPLSVSASGPNPISSYQWSPATNLNAGGATTSNPTFTSATAMTYNYTVTVTNNCGMSSTASIVVTNHANPTFTLTTSAFNACTGATSPAIGIGYTTGYTYNWTSTNPVPGGWLSSATANNPTLNVPVGGVTAPITYSYTLTRTNTATGCSVSKTRAITFKPSLSSATPAVVFTPASGSVCEGTNLSMTYSLANASTYGLTTYRWYMGTNPQFSSSSAPIAPPTALGVNQYRVKLENGCSSATSANANGEIKPAALPTITSSTTNITGTTAKLYTFCSSASNSFTASSTQAVSSWAWKKSTSPLMPLSTSTSAGSAAICTNIVNNNFYQVQANYTNGCSRKTVSTSSTYHKAVINAGCRLANPEGEEELAPEAKAYPNPFGNQLTLEYHLSADASPLITLYDIQGKVVAEKSVENQVAGDYETQMDTEGLPKGMYLLTLKAGEEIHTLKLVKE